MHYSNEKYARLLVWCLGIILDGWPWYIPFANLSDIKGGARTLRVLTDLLHDSTLKFIPAPPDVRQRALHDPESVLPHVMSAAKLPPLRLTLQPLKYSPERFRDLASHCGFTIPPSRRLPASAQTSLHAPAEKHVLHAPAEEHVLHPDNLEPVLLLPIDPDSSRPHRERRQRTDINRARHRPVSNPEGKPLRARKVGALTSHFALDRPSVASTSRHRTMKPLSEHRMPVLVSDDLGAYITVGRGESEVEDIESFSDSEDESVGQHQAKRRRLL